MKAADLRKHSEKLPDYSAKTVEWLGAVHLPSVLPRDTLVRAVLDPVHSV
jgi:hypothetical protein